MRLFGQYGNLTSSQYYLPIKEALLNSWDFRYAVKEIKNEKYKDYIYNSSMDLIPVLTRKLKESADNIPAVECIQDLLIHISGEVLDGSGNRYQA